MVRESQAIQNVVLYPYQDWPDESAGGDLLRFRLLYDGPLPSNARVQAKHAIRREFHRQLRELWNRNELLSGWLRYQWIGPKAEENPNKTYAQVLAENYALGEFKFLPLVTKEHGLACAINILMLRRDPPSGPVDNRGDIDNRLKTLFDALQRPIENNQIRGCHPNESETPFFCLLENDRLITEICVATDRLLIPLKPQENISDVRLVLDVKILVTDPRRADVEFWSGAWEEDDRGVQHLRPGNQINPPDATTP